MQTQALHLIQVLGGAFQEPTPKVLACVEFPPGPDVPRFFRPQLLSFLPLTPSPPRSTMQFHSKLVLYHYLFDELTVPCYHSE